jgi:hypothetical protein
METRTIPKEGWRSFFDSLSRIYQGETASLEVLRDDLGAQYEIEERPLVGISYDRSGIELLFVTKGEKNDLVHLIPAPKQVSVEENDAGLIVAVDFDSEDDPRAVLRLHAPFPSRLLTAGDQPRNKREDEQRSRL